MTSARAIDVWPWEASGLATRAAVTRDCRRECLSQPSLVSWYPCDLQVGPLTPLVLVVLPNVIHRPGEGTSLREGVVSCPNCCAASCQTAAALKGLVRQACDA